MSSFLSKRYLRLRDAMERGVIDEDVPCRGCGYNVRGLAYGGTCPECGQAIRLTEGLHDVLLGSEEMRARWRSALGLALACVLIGLAQGVATVIAANVAGPTSSAPTALHAIALVNAMLGLVAVWLLTPPVVLEKWPRLATVRAGARLLTVGWPLATGLALLVDLGFASGVPPHAQRTVVLLAMAAGAIGAVLVLFLLHHVAEQSELDTATRRLLNLVWLLVPVTAIAAALPATALRLMLTPLAFIILPILAVYVAWCYLMATLALALHELRAHVRWAAVHAAESMGRDERIVRTRRTLTREAERQIRDLPGATGEEVGMP